MQHETSFNSKCILWENHNLIWLIALLELFRSLKVNEILIRNLTCFQSFTLPNLWLSTNPWTIHHSYFLIENILVSIRHHHSFGKVNPGLVGVRLPVGQDRSEDRVGSSAHDRVVAAALKCCNSDNIKYVSFCKPY